MLNNDVKKRYTNWGLTVHIQLKSIEQNEARKTENGYVTNTNIAAIGSVCLCVSVYVDEFVDMNTVAFYSLAWDAL